MGTKKRPRRVLEQAKRATRQIVETCGADSVLALTRLERFDAWLQQYMHELGDDLVRRPAPEPTAPGIDRRVRGRVTYQRELVRCGKARCHCSSSSGKLHGPYWYAYHWRGGRVRKLYIGKFLKDDD